jgi:hypothetical protein
MVIKSSSILFIAAIILISGCKSSTEPPGNMLGPSITVTSNWSPSLDGGGRWFNGSDTGVWYDATLSFTLNNSSGSTKNVSYKLEIGEFKNGKYQPGAGDLFFDGDSIISGTYGIDKSTTLDLTPTIGVGRKNAKDWSYPYGYRLTLTDIATNDTYSTEGSLGGSTAENRFRGIIYTTEASPDPLGVFDGPDDGDWQVNKIPSMGPDACFPNPTMGKTTVARFSIQNNDSVVITLNKTKHNSIAYILSGIRYSGTYEIEIGMDSLKAGQYRLYYHLVDSTRVFDSYGDIKYITN